MMRILTVLFLLGIAPFARGTEQKILYRLHPGDQVHVTVFQEDDLSISARINNDGVLQVPLLEPLKVAKLSVEEAQKLIESRFVSEEILAKPQVLIQVTEFAPQEVSVLGEIRSPGKYTIPSDVPTNLVEIIARAGGFTDIGNAKQVRITRGTAGPGGSQGTQTIIIDVSKFIQGKNGQEQPPLIQDGDIIHVPQTIF